MILCLKGDRSNPSDNFTNCAVDSVVSKATYALMIHYYTTMAGNLDKKVLGGVAFIITMYYYSFVFHSCCCVVSLQLTTCTDFFH